MADLARLAHVICHNQLIVYMPDSTKYVLHRHSGLRQDGMTVNQDKKIRNLRNVRSHLYCCPEYSAGVKLPVADVGGCPWGTERNRPLGRCRSSSTRRDKAPIPPSMAYAQQACKIIIYNESVLE